LGTRDGPDAEIAALCPCDRLCLTAEAHTRSERPTGYEKKNVESKVRGVFQLDDARQSAWFGCPSGGWLAGLVLNFRFARYPKQSVGRPEQNAKPGRVSARRRRVSALAVWCYAGQPAAAQ
jgi:hypothetical protein